MHLRFSFFRPVDSCTPLLTSRRESEARSEYNPSLMDERQYMVRALELAEKGRYSTSPNPMVGCVLVKGGRIIGEGFHLRAGRPHAEAEALKNVSESPAGATAFVNLEPCSHHGRTPPCAEALIEAGVTRVVVAIEDPSVHAAGSGIARLRDGGIRVDVGLLEERAAHLNELFLHSVRCGRPFVLLKAAMSLDGKLSTITGQSQWMTSEQSRRLSLALREEYDSILVGAGTVVADNPRLTRRQGLNTAVAGWTRIVLDGRATLKAGAEVLTDGDPTLLYTARAEFWKERPQSAEVVSIHSNEGRVDLDEVLGDLGRRGIRSVIVEGGSAVLSEFIARQLWQKMVLFVAPIFVGGSSANAIFASAPVKRLEEALRFRFAESKPAGPDLMITAYPGSPDVEELNSEPRRLG